MIFDLQKASIGKRFLAFLFDFILLCVAVAGFAFLLSAMVGFNGHNTALHEAYDRYETEYGVLFDITQEEFMQKSEAEQNNWNAAYQALLQDKEAMYSYNMVVNLTLVIISLAILFGYLALEFAVPVKFGHGQTLGKKIFGVAVMRTDGVKITAPLLFIRTVLGKFTMETMIPVLVVVMIFFHMIGIAGLIILGLILLLLIILMIITHTNSCIHDVLAKTVVVEFSSQMIFESEEDKIAYKNKVHAEKDVYVTY